MARAARSICNKIQFKKKKKKILTFFKDFQTALDAGHNRDYFRAKRQLQKWKKFKRVEFIAPPNHQKKTKTSHQKKTRMKNHAYCYRRNRLNHSIPCHLLQP
jgi:hypothetical protein